MTDTTNQETFAFSADISQLMSLIINTFYSNKDIFLRELISNASDALDKIRFASLSDITLIESEPEFKIQIYVDQENKVLHIQDTGVGMKKSDLVEKLGTIAKSGTKQFMEALDAGSDLSLIGQFGVGFYSAFLVADNVVVTSKHNDDDAYTWQSSAGGSFTVEKVEDDTLKRGTRISLHIKEDLQDYLTESKIKELIKKHSEFIDFKIELQVEKEIEKPVADVEEVEDGDEDDEDDEDGKVEEVLEESATEGDVKDDKEPEKIMVKEWEHLNKNKPIWQKSESDTTDEERNAFYKAISNDWEDPLAYNQFHTEGNLEFRSILFTPGRAPFDMFQSNEKKKNNVQLYVRRVFITDDCADLMPDWLSFVKGVVDSEDLPLNISREMLQQNKIMRVIRKHLVKKSLEMFSTIAEDKGKFKKFYDAFGKNLKLGVHEDEKNREKIAEFLQYASSASEEVTTLKEYVEKMKEGQPGIYYITGESLAAVKRSPFLEQLNKRGYEVLYMVDAIDEYVMQALKKYSEKDFICISKEDLKLGETDEEKKTFEEVKKEFEPVCKKIKELLGDAVEKVVVSNRIVDSPCCLVTSSFGWSANMERIMKAQALQDSSSHSYMKSKKIMEINPSNAIINCIKDKCASTETDSSLRDLVFLLLETSKLRSGFSIEDPTDFAIKIDKLIHLGLGLDDDEVEEELPPISEETTDGGDAMEQVD